MRQKAFSITDLVNSVGIGRTALYAEIRSGRLVSRKIGRRTVVLEADLDIWLNSLPSSNPSCRNAQAASAVRQ